MVQKYLCLADINASHWIERTTIDEASHFLYQFDQMFQNGHQVLQEFRGQSLV